MDAKLRTHLQQLVSEIVFTLLQWKVGKTFVWTFSSFLFICIHKLQMFRLQLTLQSLPSSTEGLKCLSVEGLMKTCHRGMWDGAWRFTWIQDIGNVSEISNTAMTLDNVCKMWGWPQAIESVHRLTYVSWNNYKMEQRSDSECTITTWSVLDLGCI